MKGFGAVLALLLPILLLGGPYRTELPRAETPVALSETTKGARVSKGHASGVLRIRLEGARRYGVRVLLGTDAEATGFALEGRNLVPLSRTAGRTRPVDLPTWIGPHRGGRTALDLTLCPLEVGTVLTVSDPAGEILAVAHAPPAATPSRIEIALDERTALQSVTQRPLCAGIPDDDGPPVTVLVDDGAGLNALESTQDGTVVRTTPSGLEAMACGGYAMRGLHTLLPWKHIDDATFQALKRPLPAGPVDLTASYKDAERVEAILRRWHERFPQHTRLEKLGVSRQGRAVLALAIADNLRANDSRPTLLLNGSHHGDELLSIDVALDAAQQLLTSPDPSIATLRERVVTWVVPLVNPDGNAVFLRESTRAGRKNGHDLNGDGRRGLLEGVDLNRNYPFQWNERCTPSCSRANPESLRYRGPEPASEPETRAMIALVERERFLASLSFHMGTVAVLYPHEGASDPTVRGLASRVAQALGRHPSGVHFAARAPHDDVRGSDQDWFHHAVGTRALLIEIYGWPPPLTVTERREILEAMRPAWMTVAAFVAAQKRSTSSR